MSKRKIIFVREAQVLMCLFEACFDKSKNKIIRHCENIISNIKPEIGKSRPVVVVHRHRRNKLALVIPFTTMPPTDEIDKTVHIPSGVMPGVLGKKECWALCDMIQVVSIERLQEIYTGEKDTYYRRLKSIESVLPEKYYSAVCLTASGIIAVR
jgi:uncharacterized protein YifN (PemK superfamily)